MPALHESVALSLFPCTCADEEATYKPSRDINAEGKKRSRGVSFGVTEKERKSKKDEGSFDFGSGRVYISKTKVGVFESKKLTRV